MVTSNRYISTNKIANATIMVNNSIRQLEAKELWIWKRLT